MLEVLRDLLSSDSLSPHGICLTWRPELIWTHVTADAIIGLAYFSIPLVLARLGAKRPDFGFAWVLWGFVAFILACGTTHFMSIWTLWVPDYGWEALVKVVTAMASVVTAVMLWFVLPHVLAMPSTEQLRKANVALKYESEERQRVEAMLWQAQKMEAIGQLTGGVAHDFNNLLTAIQISLDRAQRLSLGGDPKLQKAIELANHATEKAGLLTGRMLAFARKQPLNPDELDLNELLLELSPLLRNILGDACKLTIVVDSEAYKVFADRNQLEQVLLNLAVNARDAMPDGGSLTLATRRPELATQGAAPTVVISVADTGEGMSEDVRARAFEPFFTTKPVGAGSGLGLSQVYGFVEQSNGKIRLESRPGIGTTIFIELPTKAKA